MITIGRFVDSRDPIAINYDGDNLALSGMVFAGNADYADVLRQQLLGLDGNADEPDVPVRWTRDDGIDGYYTVKSTNVSPIRAVTYNQFKFGYSVQLERVNGGFAAPLCEVAATMTVRTNGHAVTAPTGYVAIPTSATFKRGVYSNGNFTRPTTVTGVPRNSSTGDLDLFLSVSADGTFGTYSFATAPVDHYDGAATIEQSVGGVYYPVVGDQIGSVTGNLLRIGNGLVRMTFHTDGVISSEVWDGSVWESATSFEILGGTTLKWSAAGSWRILRNSPDVCTIQTAITYAAALPANNYYRAVTLHIERGRMLVEIFTDGLYYPIPGSTFAETMELQRAVNVAATSITGGIRQTSDDGNGHRWMMVCASAVTKDTANGSLTIAAPGAALVGQFGLGWERNGSTGTEIYDAVTVADEYFLATGSRQRVVAR